MKKTQIKDILRNIRKQMVSFISVIVIAMLGVAVFLGLDYSAAGMTRNGSAFFQSQNFRDIEMVSTLLFTQQDLAEIRSTEGVADAEAVFQVAGKASSGGDRRDVNVISLTERINRPRLVEGRLPETETECAVEKKLADEMGWTLGDEITVQDAAGETVQYLGGERFTLVGIADHPDHGNTLVTDTCYVIVTPAAFDAAALDGGCMKVEVAVEKAADIDRYSKEYTAAVAAVQERLEALAQTGEARRDAAVQTQAQTELESGRQELADAQAELEAARQELDDGWAALSEGEQKLQDAQAELEAAQQELLDGEAELADAKAQLDAGQQELEDAKARLDDGKAQLDGAKSELLYGWGQLEDAKAQIRGGIRSAAEAVLGDAAGSIPWAGRMGVNVDAQGATAMQLWITGGYAVDLNQSLSGAASSFAYSGAITDEMLLEAYMSVTGTEEGFDAAAMRDALAAAAASAAGAYEGSYAALQSACRQWDDGHAQYWAGLDEYYTGLRQYEEGLAAFEEGKADYEDGLARYEDGKAAYEQGLADYEAGQQKLDDSRKQLEDGEAAYADGLAAYGDGEQQLAEAQKLVDGLDPCRWLILDGSGNPGYVQIRMAGDNLISLKGTFALLFILVGALVIFATVSKMVDEQRTQVGTTKALGFFNREVFAKYLSFGVTATVLGAVLGILAAFFALEKIALGGYNNFYTFDITRPVITANATLISLLAAAALALLAVWAACFRLLRTPAIRLIQARIPQGAKKAAKGGKHALSLYSRLILLNIRSDLRRVLVTVVSVAGCCALIVIGVTLRTGLMGSLDRQFGDITDYDWRVDFVSEESPQAQEEIEAALKDAGADCVPLYFANITYRVSELQISELFVCDVDAVQDYYHFNDWKTGEPLTATDDGILIQRRVAEMYGLDVGSDFEIALGGTKSAAVRVAGVFEHFVGRPMLMSAAYYEKVFGMPCEPNVFFVRLNGADEAALTDALRAIPGFTGVIRSDESKAVFDSSTSVINSLVVLFIFMGAVMAGVVLMNLTTMYVLQKKRELTIMRVNGFTTRETVSYLLRETYVTTALGILLGLGVGSWIGYIILRSLEQPFAQFVRSVSIPAWIVGAGLTVLFTVFVNLIALRPVKKLKLTDVA